MFRYSVAQTGRFNKRTALLALIGAAVLSTSAAAVDIAVTTDADSGAGSLREAFTNAASGDRIVFDIGAALPTITLLSDLPTVGADVSFANNNTDPVTIDRNGNGPLNFTGSLVDPTVLVVTGVTPPDIAASTATKVIGSGDVTGNLDALGAIGPGADANPGTIGTFNLTGDLNVAGAQVVLDVSASGGTTANDLINVTGDADVSGATLAPNFIGDEYSIGQTFLVLDAGTTTGTFANAGDAFALPNNPFLEAIMDPVLGADDFGFLIQDNGNTFASVVAGCNQTSAANLLDQFATSGSPPPAVVTLRTGSTEQVSAAVDQLSGTIYPALIGAEINHIQNNLESVRDRAALQRVGYPGEPVLMPWVRAYGVSAQVSRDDCLTPGYRHEIAGVELGCGVARVGAMSAHIFGHMANANVGVRGVDQHAGVDSYSMGGLVEYIGNHLYLIASGGGGVQKYGVRRLLTAFDGSEFAASTFDGQSGFGYFEFGPSYGAYCRPYLAMHATRVELDAITESGDADFALSNNGGAGDSLRGIMGFAVNKSNLTPIGLATTRLRIGWSHEYLDLSETIVSAVPSGGSLTDIGVNAGSDWAFVRTQLDWFALVGGQFTLAYEGQFNSNSSYNTLLGGVRWVY